MTNEEITDKLDEINQMLNGIGGRLLVPAMGRPPIPGSIKEAHQMTLAAGIKLDELINELL
jgi:hypothetical protein